MFCSYQVTFLEAKQFSRKITRSKIFFLNLISMSFSAYYREYLKTYLKGLILCIEPEENPKVLLVIVVLSDYLKKLKSRKCEKHFYLF